MEATIVTPLGTFDSSVEGYWVEAIPGYSGLGLQTDTDSHDISAEELSQGFYETSNRDYGPAEPWSDIQLAGTPRHWVYVFWLAEDEYRGFWVDPEKIQELPWEQDRR